jgi:hypothetical protein
MRAAWRDPFHSIVSIGSTKAAVFSGAGLRNTEHIAPRKHVRDGLVLNWGGSFVASRFDGGENFG